MTYLCPAPTPTGPCQAPLPCKGHLIETPQAGLLIYGGIFLRPAENDTAAEFGFRRRCGWCAVQLQWWQLNLCQRCKPAAVYSPSPPCPEGSRWSEKPDARPRWLSGRAR